MPIVINEFEIVVDPRPVEQAPDPAAAGQDQPVSPASLRPEDVERIIERLRMRRERIRAD
jgi:hypothetical protein